LEDRKNKRKIEEKEEKLSSLKKDKQLEVKRERI
jgi:hypothetical protein